MKRLFFLLLLLLFFIFKPASAFAEKINSFDVQITAHKDGLIDITETINYDFEDLDRHGIYRFIPLYSKVGNLYRVIKIENVKIQRDNNSENFEKTQTKEQINIKIGNKKKTITGVHIYKISYTVENGIGSNFLDHDEIYWSATGNSWEIPIEAAKVTVSTDFSSQQKAFICFTGITGSKDKDCELSGNTGTTLKPLSPGEGLTAVAVYPTGTFPKSILSKEPPLDFMDKLSIFIWNNIFIILFFFNFIIPVVLILWYQKNKNKKRFGPPTVNFDTPQDETGGRISPAVAGTIDTAKLEKDDITATIFDLAIRKYIKLEEKTEQMKAFGIINNKKTSQYIIKLREDDGKFEPHEITLFKRLFKNGDRVEVFSLNTDFYETYQEMEKNIFEILVEKKYYTKNPKTQRILLLSFGVVALGTFSVILSGVLFFLANKLKGRTALGDEVDFKIDGLKLFLKNMDRNYKWQAKNFYTVEQMIPYAMALGYTDKFMENLKILKPDYSPLWYSGYSGSFYASYLGFYSAVGSNITTSAPSSSSGFSGGSSGGGGGGGGGGSW